MKRALLSFFTSIYVMTAHSQQQVIEEFFRYSDFHIHPTYKHYFRPRSAEDMKQILKYTRLDLNKDSTYSIYFIKQSIVDDHKNDNWIKNPKTKNRQIARGSTSNLRNYDQASYSELAAVPGSVLCNSYSPYEKQFAFDFLKRITSSVIVTKMGSRRLKAYSKPDHTPFKDFLAEYFYNYMQEETRLVKLFYNDSTGSKNLLFHNRIHMVKDGDELHRLVQQNDIRFRDLHDYDTITTPLLMSIEGAQVIYDTFSSTKARMRDPLMGRDGCPLDQQEFLPENQILRTAVKEEFLQNIHTLRNLPHRLFFITLGHFAQNHITGFAKTLDRDPENIAHRAISTLTKVPNIRNDLLHKTYAGINPVDTIGVKVIEAFLDPTKSKYKKPTYIDVKHMDIFARIQYYYMRRHYQRLYRLKKLPIIASHFAVSGENQAMAAATGLWPNFDRYPEIEGVRSFYDNYILFGNDTDEREDYWKNRLMETKGYPSRAECPLTPFEKRLYQPLDFFTDTIVKSFNPFSDYNLKANKDAGWFYPWSINLFDEEIIEIDKSDGIIGLLMDPRQLGVFMPNYTKPRSGNRETIDSLIQSLDQRVINSLGLIKNDLNYIEYLQVEPLLRNIFYIVRLVKRQQVQESYYWDSVGKNLSDTRLRYRHYIEDTIRCLKDPWKLIAIGSDYDGLIDPINTAPTVSFIPMLRKKLILYALVFSLANAKDYYDPFTDGPLITDLKDSYDKMKDFFYENGKNFMLEYF